MSITLKSTLTWFVENFVVDSLKRLLAYLIQGTIMVVLALMLAACGDATGTKEEEKSRANGASLSANGAQSTNPGLYPLAEEGRSIYQKACISCHGQAGDGMYVINTERFTRETLAAYIDTTMPTNNVGSCQGECAEATADFILNDYQLTPITVSESSPVNPIWVKFVNPGKLNEGVEFSDLAIEVDASSSLGAITRLTLFINDQFVRDESVFPYLWRPELDPTLNLLQKGDHELRVEATDSEGNTTSATQTLKLLSDQDDEPVDFEKSPIDLQFKNPVHEASLEAGSQLSVEVSATSAMADIQNVRLYVNDKFVRQENVVPYTWDASRDNVFDGLDPGTYVLRAEAEDGNSNVASTSITFYVGLKANKPPTIRLIKPNNDLTLIEGDDLQVSLDIIDPEQHDVTVALFLNNGLVREISAPPYVWAKPLTLIDGPLRDMDKGRYLLRALARDSLGVSTFIEFSVHVQPKQTVPLSGEELYTQHCAGCHKPLNVSEKLNKNIEQIKSALDNVRMMQSLDLTQDEVALIAVALNQTNTGSENPQFPSTEELFPNSQFEPINRRAYRLTKPQIIKAINLILGIELPPNVLGSDEKVGAFANQANVLTINSTDFLESITDVLEKHFPVNTNEEVRLFVGCPAVNALSCTNGSCACIENFIEQSAKQLYRRPVDANELIELKQLYQSFLGGGLSYADSIQFLLGTLFISPDFLFRYEASDPGSQALAPLELLTHYSLVLTDTLPSLADIDTVAELQSGTPAVERFLEQYIETTLNAQSSNAILARFLKQWLDIDINGIPDKDPALFPDLTEGVKSAMIREVDQFINYIVQQDKLSVNSLFTSNYTYLESELASFYGVNGVGNTTVGETRQGILGKGAYTALNSGPLATNPTRRGSKLVSEVLCYELPGLPSGLQIEPANPNEQPLTNREKFEVHSQNPECASCHEVLDPLGFGLENFAADGSYRQTDNGYAINAADTFDVLPYSSLNFDGPAEMSAQIASAPETLACMVRQAFRYTHGYSERPEDDPILAQAMESYQSSGFDIRSLFESLLKNKLAQRRN